MTSKIFVFVLLLTSLGLAQGVAGDPGVGDSGSAAAPAATPVRDFKTAGATSASPATAAMTVVSGDLIVGWGAGLGGFTVGSGFTNRASAEADTAALWEDKLASGTSVVADATLGSSNDWVMIGIAFKASGTPAYVQSLYAFLGSSPLTVGSQTFTSGNLLVACASTIFGTPTTITVTDSRGNTWTPVNSTIKTFTGSSYTWDAQCFWAMSKDSGAGTVTFTFDGGGTGRVAVAEYSGVVSN